MKKNIIVALALLLLISLYIFYFLNKPATTTVSEDAVYKLTASQLFTEFKENEQKANDKYLDEVLQVEGVVKEKLDESQTLLFEGGGMFGVSCEIMDGERYNAVNAGDSVKVKALCTGMLMDVVLIKGEIVE